MPLPQSPLDTASLLSRAAKVRQSYEVGGKRIGPNVYLAPMSGVTDMPFRRLIARLTGYRTGLLVSEFISVEGLTRRNPKAFREMAFSPEEERPFTVQIFGSEPRKMALGAQFVEASGADFVEINCGCPAPRVVSKGGGSGLLKDLPRLANIVRSVVAAVKIPVTVKVRVGWDDNLITLFATQDIVEGEGAQALVIHGRTRAQAYRGLANWNLIAEAKARARIPVIGNGDVLTAADAIGKFERYGVDGIAVGRGAMHNPWMFRDIADLYDGIAPREPTAQEQLQLFADYLALLREEMDIEMRLLGKAKQMAARLMKLQRGSAMARLSLLRSQSLTEFQDHLETFFASPQAALGRDFQALGDLNGKPESSEDGQKEKAAADAAALS